MNKGKIAHSLHKCLLQLFRKRMCNFMQDMSDDMARRCTTWLEGLAEIGTLWCLMSCSHVFDKLVEQHDVDEQ